MIPLASQHAMTYAKGARDRAVASAPNAASNLSAMAGARACPSAAVASRTMAS